MKTMGASRRKLRHAPERILHQSNGEVAAKSAILSVCHDGEKTHRKTSQQHDGATPQPQPRVPMRRAGLVRAHRERDDGNCRPAAQAFQHFGAVHVGEPQIENDQIRRTQRGPAQGFDYRRTSQFMTLSTRARGGPCGQACLSGMRQWQNGLTASQAVSCEEPRRGIRLVPCAPTAAEWLRWRTRRLPYQRNSISSSRICRRAWRSDASPLPSCWHCSPPSPPRLDRCRASNRGGSAPSSRPTPPRF
jgi:hypothetical protein